MGDEDDGLVEGFLELLEFVLEVAADDGVEGAEGLVHEQDGGVHGEGAGEADALLHAAGEFGGHGAAPAAEADEFEGLFGAVAAVASVGALDFEAPGGVVEHGAVGHEAEVLEDHGEFGAAEFAEFFVGEGGDFAPAEPDFADGGVDQAVDAADEGGFAAAGETHDDEDLALADIEGDVAEGKDAAGVFLDVVFGFAVAGELEGFFFAVAEDLVDAADGDQGVVGTVGAWLAHRRSAAPVCILRNATRVHDSALRRPVRGCT